MNSLRFLIIALLAIDIHLNQALYLSDLSVPRIIDVSQKPKLSCSYVMGNRTLNSVKWYKDGQEFFRYSPLTPPTTNWFPVAGVTIAEGSSHCNQFICNVELENLNANSSGSYRCEVSGDAPEFKLVDKTANMTVGVFHKTNVSITGVRPQYKYGDYVLANCSVKGSTPMAKLTWFINSAAAPISQQQPQVYENTRTTDGFLVSDSILPLRINIENPRFKAESQTLQLRCVADIMNTPGLRKEANERTIILAHKDAGRKQRHWGQGNADDGLSGAANINHRQGFWAWLSVGTLLLPTVLLHYSRTALFDS